MNSNNSSEDQFNSKYQLKRSTISKGSSLFIVSIVKFMTVSTSFYSIFNSRMLLKFRLSMSWL